MVPSPGEYKLENADNGKANQQHWHIILFKVKWPSIQKIFRFCLFRLVELTRLKLATTRKEEKERSINSIISSSLPSDVLPCFLPVLSHHHVFSAEKLNHEVVTGRDLTIVCIFIISPLKLPISGCYRDGLFISPPSSKLLIITVNIICRENSGCSGAWTTLTSWWSDPQRALEGWLSPSSRWGKWRWGLPSSKCVL